MAPQKPNNVIYQKVDEKALNRVWIEFLTPFHNLAKREKDVAARILMQYQRLKEQCKDPDNRDMLRELLWSHSSRLDMRTSLGMSQPHFQMILRKLRDVGFLIGYNGEDINPRYIPHIRPESPVFELRILFDYSDSAKPVSQNETV